jgi:hypothetical protein
MLMAGSESKLLQVGRAILAIAKRTLSGRFASDHRFESRMLLNILGLPSAVLKRCDLCIAHRGDLVRKIVEPSSDRL